jgi:hypothetical protein
MRRTLLLMLIFCSVTLVAAPGPPPRGDEEKIPTIKEIMRESHQCQTAYIKTVRDELKKDQPSWSLVESKSRDLIKSGKLLAKNTPPKGTPEAWEKITGVYTANAVLLTDAAERRDKDTAIRHQQAMFRMCAACHRAHR